MLSLLNVKDWVNSVFRRVEPRPRLPSDGVRLAQELNAARLSPSSRANQVACACMQGFSKRCLVFFK